MDPIKEIIYKCLKSIKEGVSCIPNLLCVNSQSSLDVPSILLDMSNLSLTARKEAPAPASKNSLELELELELENNFVLSPFMPNYSDYEKFSRRLSVGLNHLQVAGMNPKLKALISEKDLKTIYHFFSKGGKKEKKIIRVERGEALRFSKEKTGLARTLNLLRSQSGEYQLILETKQKLSNGTKHMLPKISGTFKKGKPAWRIDGELIEYFNATVKMNDVDRELSDLQEEVKISQLFFRESGINVTDLGQVFFKNRGDRREYKVSVYSEKAISDLSEFLYKNQAKLTNVQKNKMISDLLQALKLFHDQRLVHQDLKLSNILVYKTSFGVYKLKLTDFGTAREHQQMNEEAVATAGYQSPEIEYYHSVRKSGYYDYFNIKNKDCSALGKEVYQKDIIDPDVNRKEFKTPHKANDIWAMGIIIYKIIYGVKPTVNDFHKIKKHPVLAKMLRPHRENRCDIDKAIALHQQVFSVNKIAPRIRI